MGSLQCFVGTLCVCVRTVCVTGGYAEAAGAWRDRRDSVIKRNSAGG